MNSNKQPRSQLALGIGKSTSNLHRSRAGINSVIDDIDHPLVWEPGFVGHFKANFHIIPIAGGVDFVFANFLLNIEQRALIDIKIGVDGIERHNGSQRSAVGCHQVSFCNQFSTGSSGNGSRHLRKILVELGFGHARLSRVDRGLGV